MVEETEDCGCDSGNPKKIEPEDIDYIKDRMSETKEKLESMMDTFKGLNFNTEKFDKMESEIGKLSDYMHSGEFLSSLEKLFESGANKSIINPELVKEYFDKKQNYMNNLFSGIDPSQMEILQSMTNTSQTKPKTPIGYVFVDENGEQKFSPTKPEGIVSTPVYGD